jgi:hypothetical protein
MIICVNDVRKLQSPVFSMLLITTWRFLVCCASPNNSPKTAGFGTLVYHYKAYLPSTQGEEQNNYKCEKHTTKYKTKIQKTCIRNKRNTCGTNTTTIRNIYGNNTETIRTKYGKHTKHIRTTYGIKCGTSVQTGKIRQKMHQTYRNILKYDKTSKHTYGNNTKQI